MGRASSSCASKTVSLISITAPHTHETSQMSAPCSCTNDACASEEASGGGSDRCSELTRRAGRARAVLPLQTILLLPAASGQARRPCLRRCVTAHATGASSSPRDCSYDCVELGNWKTGHTAAGRPLQAAETCKQSSCCGRAAPPGAPFAAPGACLGLFTQAKSPESLSTRPPLVRSPDLATWLRTAPGTPPPSRT